MDKLTIIFSKNEKLKAENSAYRKALVETGCYAVPQHKVHKNKKKYDRKRDKRVEIF